jgi:transcriptional regulator with XRE-family HTH domain
LTLGNAIKLVRTASGIKQRALAKNLDISANYLSLIENGKREPSISFLRRLARELGVPMGIFFLWQEIDPIKSRNSGLDNLRELLTRLEGACLSGIRQKARGRKKAA